MIACTISISPDPIWAYNGPTNIVANAVDAKGNKVIRVKDKAGLPDREAAKATPTLQKAYIDALMAAPMIDLDPDDQAIKNADQNFIPHPFVSILENPLESDGSPNPHFGKIPVMLDPVSSVMEDLLAIHNEPEEDVSAIFGGNYLTIGNTALPRNGPAGLMIPSIDWKP